MGTNYSAKTHKNQNFGNRKHITKIRISENHNMNINISNESTNQHMIGSTNPYDAIGKLSPKTKRSMVNRISTFNDMGASAFQSGNCETSEMFFTRAASELGIHFKNQAKPLSPESPDTIMGDPSESDQLVNPSRYDEGMHVYNAPLKLPANPQQEGFQHISTAVVAFNMAQVHIKKGKTAQAEHWLHQHSTGTKKTTIFQRL